MPFTDSTVSHLSRPLMNQLRSLLPQGQASLHLAGTLLNDNVVFGVKPSCIDDGVVFYIRDKEYYATLETALRSIHLDNLVQLSDAQHPARNSEMGKKQLKKLKEFYTQYFEK